MGLNDCAVYGCERPAVTGGMCVGHGGKSQPGISEPEVEARARAAGDAAMRKALEETGFSPEQAKERVEFELRPRPHFDAAPILDVGEDYRPGPMDVDDSPEYHARRSTVPAGPEVYVTACLHGEHGAMRKAVAEAMIRAVEQGLRAL